MPKLGRKLRLMEALDVRTRKPVQVQKPKIVVTKNGRYRLTGYSPSGSTVSKFVSKADAEKIRRMK